jgi:hypothetical protein
MQIDVQDLFDISFSRNVRYDTVSIYDTLNFSLFLINCHISILVGQSCYSCGQAILDMFSDHLIILF